MNSPITRVHYRFSALDSGLTKKKKKSYCMLELTLKRKSGAARRVKAHQDHEKWKSVYSDLNRFKKNFRLIACTLLKKPAKYECITNKHNHSGQGARIVMVLLKPKKPLLSKYLLSNPPPPPVLFIYVFICFSERINIVGSQ